LAIGQKFRNKGLPGWRIKGIAQQGVIIGGIRPDTIEVTGRGAPPPATPVEPEDLTTGRHHYRRITIEGVIRRVMPAGDAALALVLHTAGTSVRIEVEAAASEAEAQARRLVDARVRATGIVVGNVNDRRQVVEPFIRVKRPADVEVLEPPPADPFAIPITPLDALATRLARQSPAARVAGALARVDALRPRLARAVAQRLASSRTEISYLERRLRSAGPEETLARGYAIVTAADGSLVRSVAAAPPGAALQVQLADGTVPVRVAAEPTNISGATPPDPKNLPSKKDA
jgi:hypothetical protein